MIFYNLSIDVEVVFELIEMKNVIGEVFFNEGLL